MVDALLDKSIYYPDADVIVKLYEKLAKGESLSLEWKNPGRYLPEEIRDSPVKRKEKGSEKKKSKTLIEEIKPKILKDFEFEEYTKFDFKSSNNNKSLQLEYKTKLINKDSALYSSEKKKKKVNSTSFNDVLKDVIKHRVWEKEDALTSTASSNMTQAKSSPLKVDSIEPMETVEHNHHSNNQNDDHIILDRLSINNENGKT